MSDVHKTIFDYVMLIFDGFKGVIEDVSLQKWLNCYFEKIPVWVLAGYYSSRKITGFADC